MPNTPIDSWFGRDKLAHFAVSFVIALGVFEFFRHAGHLPLLACAVVGGVVSITVGILKEVLDLLGFGTPSWKDLTADAVGIVCGIGLGLLITAL